MKKIIKVLLIIALSFTSLHNISYATWETSEVQTTTVTTTEAIPWASCIPEKTWDVTVRTYKCTVKSWMESFFDILKALVKYFLFIAVLVIVLMIALSGIRMSIAGKNDAAKKQFIHLIEAILIIFLMWSILKIIAPWIYQ